jgi:hypothetical protein
MNEDTEKGLLLRLVSLLAERHGCHPNEGFEFKLWRDIAQKRPKLVSQKEAGDLQYISGLTNHWVTGDLETGQFVLIDLPSWQRLLEP